MAPSDLEALYGIVRETRDLVKAVDERCRQIEIAAAEARGERRGALGVARWAFPSLGGLAGVLSSLALWVSVRRHTG